jgi:ELWxxDGT repeat protein
MSVWVLFFGAVDSNTDDELWYYYNNKFFEVTAGEFASDGGLYPAYLDAYGNDLIFEGTNAAGDNGMWLSNGTRAGTHQITGIKYAYQSEPGVYQLDPSLFRTYKNIVLFDGMTGLAGSPIDALWVTNGTAKGTYQLGGYANRYIKGANTTLGLLAYTHGFTLFDGLAFFDGYDKAGNIGLWRTDGTVAGTYEIQPIVGAVKVGTPGSDIQPDYMCVVGTKMFFAGEDLQDSQYSLWVTNGTAKGTIEIGGQGNRGVKSSPYGNAMNLPAGMGPTDITAFDGKAIFSATDNTLRLNGYYAHTEGLWISDGTAAGTIEIGGRGSQQIKNAQHALLPDDSGGGLEGGVGDPDFTVYKNEVLFLGVDDKSSPGQMELWETNGTVAGTTEIGGLGNAGIKGHPVFAETTDPHSPDFTVYGGEVFFTAMSGTTNQWGIWETNGTAAGTHLLKNIGYYLPTTDFTIGKA